MSKRLERYPVPHISYSQLSTFLRCSYSFHQAYILKNRDSGNKYSKLGNAFHDVAEKYPCAGDPKEIGGMYLKEFRDIPIDMFEDQYERQEFFDKGLKAIKNFGKTYQGSAQPVSVEKKLHVKVHEDVPPVLAFIDRIDGDPDDPSTWIITDYKTSNNPWPKSKLKEEFQLGLYALLCYKAFGAYPAAVQYYFPVPDKFVTAVHIGDGVYEYQNQRSPVLTIDVADVMLLVAETVEKIMEGDFKTTLCGTYFCNKFCFYKQQGGHEPAPIQSTVDWGEV